MALLLWLVWLPALAGCATYSETSRALRVQLAQGQPELALETLENSPGARRDRALYLMNKGMLLRLNGEYAASNQALEEAKELIDHLVVVSISEQTAALSVNDASRSYIGEPFERVLLHLYKTLNYLALADLDAARVEILQADLLLPQFSGQERRFSGEGIMRYLSGMVFEQAGELSDAMIAYRMALEAYRAADFAVPPPLGRDLLRLAQSQGLDREAEQYREDFGIEKISGVELGELGSKTNFAQNWCLPPILGDPIFGGDRGEVIVIVGTSLAPAKQEHAVNMVDPASGRWYRVATPFYPPWPVNIAPGIRVTVNGCSVLAVLGADVDSLARRALGAAMPGITARALARAVVKGVAVKEAGENNQMLGVLANISSFVTERADTRSWITLPGKLYLARLNLPAGRYEVTVERLAPDGGSYMKRTYDDIEIRPAAAVYIQDHWIGPWAMERE